MDVSIEDLEDLRRARRLLENVSFAARLAATVGKPVEALVELLPPRASEMAMAAANKALHAALDVAVQSLRYGRSRHTTAVHRALVGASGAVGGAFGLPGLGIELPVSTVLMLRSISDIAQSEGEPLHLPASRLECLQVFALGGPGGEDDAVESGYFALRAAMAKALAEAAEHLATRGVAQSGAPALVRFVTQIAARFGVPVSQKVIAQGVPVIGAVGGAAINVLFMTHFQDIARGHFIVRRLERKYGADVIRTRYASV